MKQFSKFLQNLEKEEYNKKYGVSEVKLVGLPEDHYPNTFKTFIFVVGIIAVVIGFLVGLYLIELEQYSKQQDEYYKVWISIMFISIGVFIVIHYFFVKTEIKGEQLSYRDRIMQQRLIFLQNATFYQKQEKLFAHKSNAAKEFKAQTSKFDDFIKNKKLEIEQMKVDKPVKPKKKKKKVKNKIQETEILS